MEPETIIGPDGKTYRIPDTSALTETQIVALKMGKIRMLSQAIVKAVKEFDENPTYERAQCVERLGKQRDELRATLPGLRVVQ
jgi:hypothetical protein